MTEEEIRALIDSENQKKEIAKKMIPMTAEEKYKKEQHDLQCAREMREFTDSAKSQTEERAFSISTEFVRLEVQIATLLFALVGFFINSFTTGGSLNFSAPKVGLATAVIMLVGSLVMGLLHMKREEKFLDAMTYQRVMRLNKWKQVVEGDATFAQAKAYHEGTMVIGRGPVISSPQWPWILQTIFLGIGIASLLTLFLVFIFI